MLEFQLNYYFEKLKDISFNNRKEFRIIFKKKYGNFKDLEKLIKKIEEYQVKNYGCRVTDFYDRKTKEIRIREQQNSNRRKRQRLGKK